MTPLDQWLSTQPLGVRVLARDYPFGTRMKLENGATRFVVGWTAERQLILGWSDPGKDWLSGKVEDPIWVDVEAVG